jgi:predicted transposase/invertase (TIGR01784 family)
MLTTLINPAILEKGREEGLKEGLKEGIEKGKEEEKLDVAKKMLAEGMVIPLINKLTGLPKDDILKLKEELAGENH